MIVYVIEQSYWDMDGSLEKRNIAAFLSEFDAQKFVEEYNKVFGRMYDLEVQTEFTTIYA